jgi:hypothetical protein
MLRQKRGRWNGGRGRHAEARQAAISVGPDVNVIGRLGARRSGYGTEISRIQHDKMLSAA